MNRALSILVALLVCPVIASAQPLDKNRLRKAAYLPFMGRGVSIWPGELDEDGRKYDPARTIAALTEQLTGGDEDAATYLDLASCYKDAGQDMERKNALAKAEKLLRPHLQTNDPRQAHLVACYARYLGGWCPDRRAEAEKWARRAVELAPDDWRCWESLGWRVAQPAFALLAKDATDSYDVDEFARNVRELCRRLRSTRIPWPEVKRRLDEAHECFRKARTLASDETEAIASFGGFRAWEHQCRFAMEHVRGQVTLPENARAHPEIVQLTVELADRCPDNLNYQAEAAAALLAVGWGDLNNLPPLAEEKRRQSRKYMERLERAADKGERVLATSLRPLLAYFSLLAGDSAAFHHHARLAVDADPTLANLWLAQITVLKTEGRRAEAVQLAEARLEENPTADGCYWTAIKLFGQDYPEDTERLLRRGLWLDPGHPHCQLGLAAVLLWRGDQPAALDEAGKLLANVNPELPQPLPPAVPPFVVELFKTDVELHRAVYRALRGEDLEEQKRIVRSHFDKEPRPEKLPEVAQAFGLEVPAARINKEWLRATANVQAPTLLLPGMARHLHEQRGVPLDPAKEVARLHRQLRDTPDDALVLAKLGGVHAELGQPGEAVKNYALAKQRLEALLAGDGGNTFLQAHYVIALSTVGDNDRADRGFLKLAGENSADWRVWRCLGDYAFMRGACLLGFAMGANGQEGAWRRIENPALIQPATPADLAERWLDCAELCNAKAAHLAPRESDVWLADAFFANRGSNLRNLIRMARGQAPDPKIAEAAAARAQACLRHVCRLAPDCPYYVSVYAQAATTAKPVSVETLKEIETCLAQLDQMARTKDRDTAGHCHMNAAICRLLLDHPKQALEHARKALALLPDDEIAWNTVAALLNHEMDTVECRKLLVRKAERFPSALNHLYAAALYCNELELDAAEEHLRAGLKLAENDLNCTLAMAAIALTRGDAPEHLAQAERWLHKAGAILGEQSHPQHLFLTGVLHGLRGETLLCQAYLRQAQALDPSNQFIKHALLAVNP